MLCLFTRKYERVGLGWWLAWGLVWVRSSNVSGGYWLTQTAAAVPGQAAERSLRLGPPLPLLGNHNGVPGSWLWLGPGTGIWPLRKWTSRWKSNPFLPSLSLLSLHPTLPLKNNTTKSWHVILSKQLRLTIWNKNLKTSYCDTGSDLITTSNIFPWLPHIQMT